jgi:arylsulfatase A-like enzyme
VTNGPWHDGKGTPFEGGHRVPLIARRPGQIPAGTVSDETICFTDLLATTAAIVKVALPKGEGGDSFSVLPAQRGEALKEPIRKLTMLQGDTRDDALAVRFGPWKLIESKSGKGGKKYQLYDLVKDPGETKNLAAEQPESLRKSPRPSRRSETTAAADHDYETYPHTPHRPAARAAGRAARRRSAEAKHRRHPRGRPRVCRPRLPGVEGDRLAAHGFAGGKWRALRRGLCQRAAVLPLACGPDDRALSEPLRL